MANDSYTISRTNKYKDNQITSYEAGIILIETFYPNQKMKYTRET